MHCLSSSHFDDGRDGFSCKAQRSESSCSTSDIRSSIDKNNLNRTQAFGTILNEGRMDSTKVLLRRSLWLMVRFSVSLFHDLSDCIPPQTGVIGRFNVGHPPHNHLEVPGQCQPPLYPPQPGEYPPTPPSKDGHPLYEEHKGTQFPLVPGQQRGRQPSAQTYDSNADGRSFMSGTSALERSKYLRAVRMNPYLQLMVGCAVGSLL